MHDLGTDGNASNAPTSDASTPPGQAKLEQKAFDGQRINRPVSFAFEERVARDLTASMRWMSTTET